MARRGRTMIQIVHSNDNHHHHRRGAGFRRGAESNDGGVGMKQKYTIDIVLSDAEIYFLRRLFGKNANTGVARLVTIAVKRSVAESARQELAETGYAPVGEEPC